MKIKNIKQKGINAPRTKAKFSFFKSKPMTHPAHKMLAEMILKGGHKEFFVVRVEKNNSFSLFGKRYLANDQYMTYNRTFKMQSSLYHEDVSVPIKQFIDAKDLKEHIRFSKDLPLDVMDAINNIDPVILEDFSNTKVIVDGIQGHGLSAQFGFFKLMLILNLIAGVIGLLLLFNLSGIF